MAPNWRAFSDPPPRTVPWLPTGAGSLNQSSTFWALREVLELLVIVIWMTDFSSRSMNFLVTVWEVHKERQRDRCSRFAITRQELALYGSV
jgi:hypothetical protein